MKSLYWILSAAALSAIQTDGAACTREGLFCGSSISYGNPNFLYDCAAIGATPEFKADCRTSAGGRCQVNPPFKNDSC
ncbi:MAG: hypothetical protein BYD32DRAFT_430256 [Podila humilis]|nr:MAG: hypothetical protein BYD32DRAFT_430256 [Podila humilis]